MSNVCDALSFLLDNIFYSIWHQVVQINSWFQLGTNCAPLVADLFLFFYGRDIMMSLVYDKKAGVLDAYNTTSRYSDDILNITDVYLWHYGKSNIPFRAPT